MRHNMSLMRQLLERENDPGRGVSVSTLAREYSRGFHVGLHAHGSDQLIYASRGVMEVSSGRNLWLLPPHFALWIPARTPHHIRMPEPVSMRTLYLRSSLTSPEKQKGARRSTTVSRLASGCIVLHVGPLLRELIFEIVRVGKLRYRNPIECALRDVLIAQLMRASPVPTGVVLPKDPSALRVAQAVIANPGIHDSLRSMCESAGISVRTLERAFQREAGTAFEYWRRQVRLMKAVELLVSGRSVKEVTFAVGYQNPSSFVALFRATFGATPKAWATGLSSEYSP
jgi:AraC-like DNA-binding protein